VIGRLHGIVVERGSDGACIVDVGGVGYEVFIPLATHAKLPDPPAPAALHIHTHVREDAFTLFGFATPADRIAFRALISVANVGPKLALAVLNAMTAEQLALAIARGDAATFRGIPGVGKKTVERLIIELRDKLPLALGAASAQTVASPSPLPAQGALRTVVDALVQMGYKQSEAERAAELLRDKEASEPIEVLLREALASLR
jgi:holliday junction DNA helicase RuvA